jgi:hypothetical protein
MARELTTPVALIIFNRPERTAGVFAAMRRDQDACLSLRMALDPVSRQMQRISVTASEEKIVNQAVESYIQENFFEGITRGQRLYWKPRLPLPILGCATDTALVWSRLGREVS